MEFWTKYRLQGRGETKIAKKMFSLSERLELRYVLKLIFSVIPKTIIPALTTLVREERYLLHRTVMNSPDVKYFP